MIDRSHLSPMVEKLRDVPVLCLGDVMLDRFVYGEVERISPEAPIPVLRIQREEAMLGGAGNVARNLSALGAKAHMVGVSGGDDAGKEMSRLLDGTPGVVDCLVTVPSRPTTLKTRFIANGQQMLRSDHETIRQVDVRTRERLIDTALEALKECKAVIVSDYAKGLITPQVASQVIVAARRAGKPVIVDPKGTDYAKYAGASVLTPNRRELQEATRMPVITDDEVTDAARRLMDDNDAHAVLATRSQDGMTLVTFDGGYSHLKAEAREVYDVSGAGDTVVAVLGAALGAGVPLADAAAMANVAAGIVVGKVGTAVVYSTDLIAGLRHQDISGVESKLATLETARERIGIWRREGLKIGFTNGCFDLLHPGHISLLRQARAECDKLVVGLNSDASVTGLKGEGRPVQNETARAAVLGSLETVDLVAIFDENTPLNLIEALLPDVLVKGADYRIDQVVGASVVQENGGRVVLAELEPGHSTTATIARIG